jgi:catechol 2,3-dioxygenase-like lactoylglutathione lyase family enzyme
MPPPRVTRLDHCSVLVTDVARSRHFYGTVLGLREVPGPRTFDFVVIWYDLGGGQYLHLLLKPRPDTASPRHFALSVADAAAAREHLRAHGVATEETVPIPNADRFFVHDPDGNRIELIQWIRPYDPEADGRYLV